MSQANASITILRAENAALVESLNAITSLIRNRANQLAQNGQGNGDATRNWLQAERELFCIPNASLAENDQEYSIQLATPGCNSTNLEVVATANSLTVRSTSSASLMNTASQTSIVFSDLDSRMLYRSFDLPSAVDSSQVTATLDNGVLTIVALKASASTRRSTAARA